jgi:hypothetical protein
MSGYPPQAKPNYPYGPPPGPWPTNPSAPAAANPFADAQNPYAAPQMGGYMQPPQQPGNVPAFAGLWRQGDVMVMHKNAPLPDICLKSNRPATRRLKRSLSWHHPAVFLAILVHIILYVIIALIIRKTATIYIALTDEWFAIRRRRMTISLSLVGVSLVLFAAGCVLAANEVDWGVIFLPLSIVLGLGATIYGLVACRLVWPKRMTDEYIWLKGVNPDFLSRLEIWPYNI